MDIHIYLALAYRLEKAMNNLANILDECDEACIEISIPDTQHYNSWIGIEPQDIRGYAIKMNIQRPTTS